MGRNNEEEKMRVVEMREERLEEKKTEWIVGKGKKIWQNERGRRKIVYVN